MPSPTRQEKARRRLVKLLDRAALEQASQMTSPWHADRVTLELSILANWDDEIADEIAGAVGRLLEQAK